MTDSPSYPPFDVPERSAEIWAEAWNRRDPDRIAALVDEDAEFVNVTGLWWHDRESIREAHAYRLETIFEQSTISLLETRVTWLIGGPDTSGEAVAVVHAKMKLEGQMPVGEVDAPGVRRNLLSFVVHREEGTWSCASAHNTDIVPGSETHVVDSSGQLRAVEYRTEDA